MECLKKISIAQINSVVSRLLPKLWDKTEAKRYLQQVGELYFDFLHHPSQHLSISLPVFDLKIMTDLLKYLYYIEVLVKFSKKGEVCPERDMAIFDYFGYKAADDYNRSKKNFALSLKFVQNEHLDFENNISVRRDRFLPLFAKGAIENAEASIFAAFPLFSAIAKEGLFTHPLLIDSDADCSLLLHNNMPAIHLPYLIDVINASSFGDHDDRQRLLESLTERQIDCVISLRYPYHSNIDPIITRVLANKSKMLDIKFSSRFFHQEIQEDDLVILPNALNENLRNLEAALIDSYVVIDTGHSRDLFEAMANLKSSWAEAGLNIYQYPFPSRWLMMVHQGEPLDFYLDLAQKDFPAVQGRLFLDLSVTITLIYELNWLGKYLSKVPEAIFLLPPTNGYSQLMQSVRTYLNSSFKVVKTIDNYSSGAKDNEIVILLDVFNKVLISNMIFKESSKVTMVVPDFIFFAYQPFISYYIGKYIYDALIKGARKIFDPDYEKYLLEWSKFSSKALSVARTNLTIYCNTYQPKERPEENSILPEENLIQGLSRYEMMEILSNSQPRSHVMSIEIDSVEGKQWCLKPGTFVLCQLNGQILKLKADELQTGQFFASVEDLIKVNQHEGIVEKLSDVSLPAQQWKKLLSDQADTRTNLFADLKRMGLSVKEGTFTDVYLEKEGKDGKMSLPRSRNDWQIVGDFLGIPDISTAWINHKGWSSVNALRQVYFKVVMLVFEHYSNNLLDDDVLFDQINQLIHIANEQHQDAKIPTQDIEVIILSILSHIEFQEIKSIKYL